MLCASPFAACCPLPTIAFVVHSWNFFASRAKSNGTLASAVLFLSCDLYIHTDFCVLANPPFTTKAFCHTRTSHPPLAVIHPRAEGFSQSLPSPWVLPAQKHRLTAFPPSQFRALQTKKRSTARLCLLYVPGYEVLNLIRVRRLGSLLTTAGPAGTTGDASCDASVLCNPKKPILGRYY